MLERIVSFFLINRLWAIVILLAIVVGGAFCLSTLPIDALPDLTNIQVEVVGTAPGLSPLEMERSVAYPIERAMLGLPGLVQLRSLSKFGISVVTVVFEDRTDVYFARQLVMERLLSVREELPDAVETALGPVATAMGEIYQYTLEGDEPQDPEALREYQTDLRTLQEWVVAPMLKSVPRVNEVNSFGGYLRQYQALVNPNKLLEYDLTLDEVFDVIRNSNRNVGGGFLEEDSNQYLVRGLGLLGSTENIGSIVLKSREGTPVLLRDVAEVKAGRAVRQGAAIKDGKNETVGGIVMMLRGANSRQVVEAVKRRVAEINSGGVLPEGIRIRPYYDRSDIVKKAVHTLVKALLEGGLFVLLVLFFFLGNLRSAFVVILTLPLAALTVFLVMKVMGLSANLISLGGLAISIGMIVDVAIIQVENVQRHLSEKGAQGGVSTIVRAVLEVRKPSIFGELIIALTFLPLLSLQGLEGKMFRPLALTIFIALLAALFLSLVVIPLLCHRFVRPGRTEKSFILPWVERLYLPTLRWAMRSRLLVVGAALLLFLASLSLIPTLGTEFMPVMDEGAFDMDTQLPPGVSLTQSLEISRQAGAILKSFPELKTVVSRTGWSGMAIEARGVESTGFVGILKPKREWRSAGSREELTEKMRKALSALPGLAFSFSQPIQCRVDELVSGTRAQVVIKLFGEDLSVLREKGEAIAGVLMKVRGTRDLMVEQVSGQPYVNVRLDRRELARHGMKAEDVLSLVETGIGGKAAGLIYQGAKYFDLQVRLSEERRTSVETLRNLLADVPGESGAKKIRVPLSQLARIAVEEGPSSIGRENGERRLLIQCNIEGRDMGGFVAEAQKQIREKVPLPAGYYLTWGGQFENQSRAMARLAVIVPLTILLVAFLLFVTFNSWSQAVLVLLNLPLAVIGGILALFLSRLYLSVPASVGFITLFGVAVLNGVVLVSTINQLREEGTPLAEAVEKSCIRRLRPILMTASVTCLSLIPMLFATGPGSEIQKPLAVVVVGGLATSTLLTLIILPVLYSRFEGKKREMEF
ncbi:MAG: CusA/CzcA family heavy metal efflux RND transporter [bacterium]